MKSAVTIAHELKQCRSRLRLRVFRQEFCQARVNCRHYTNPKKNINIFVFTAESRDYCIFAQTNVQKTRTL